MKKWIAILAVICLLPASLKAQTTDTILKQPYSFAGQLYQYVWHGPDKGRFIATMIVGVRVTSNVYVGAEMADVDGVPQGGIGPTVVWVDSTFFCPHIKIIGDLGYLDKMRYDAESGKVTWGAVGGLGFVVSMTDKTHLVLGLRCYPYSGPFLGNLGGGAGLFISDPAKQLAAIWNTIDGLF